MTTPADRAAGQINHCHWVVCAGCGIEFHRADSYDFVGEIRRAGWEVDWSKGGWRCRDCRRMAVTGQKKLL
jgi:hypothetical protein